MKATFTLFIFLFIMGPVSCAEEVLIEKEVQPEFVSASGRQKLNPDGPACITFQNGFSNEEVKLYIDDKLILSRKVNKVDRDPQGPLDYVTFPQKNTIVRLMLVLPERGEKWVSTLDLSKGLNMRINSRNKNIEVMQSDVYSIVE